MKLVDIDAGNYDLSARVDEAAAGEEIVLQKNGEAVARLTAVPKPKAKDIGSTFGMLKGKVWISDDFDDPLPDDILKGFGVID
jgi:antitoxin (DNA-binding transcriptional repressor) of toxin-antitoxin stability system